MEEATTFAFEVTVRGTLTVDWKSMEGEAQARGISKAMRGAELVQATIEDMAPPGTGPITFEQVNVPIGNIHPKV